MMTKKIKLRKLDGGALMTIVNDDSTNTEVFVFKPYMGKETEKFYIPAGNMIFGQLNNFEVLYDDDEYDCKISHHNNGYHVTITLYDKIICEFVEEITWFPSSPRDAVNGKLFNNFIKIFDKHFMDVRPNSSELTFEIKILE